MRKRFQLINVDVDILQKTVVRCPWIDKAWNTTNSPKPVGRFTKTSLFDSTTSCKASSWCLLSLSNPKTSHSFLNASSAIFSHVFARDPCKNFRVTSSNDWSLTADVTEIFLGSVSKTVFFGGRKDNKRKFLSILANLQEHLLFSALVCSIKVWLIQAMDMVG